MTPAGEQSLVQTVLRLVGLADELQADGRMRDAAAVRAGITAIMDQLDELDDADTIDLSEPE